MLLLFQKLKKHLDTVQRKSGYSISAISIKLQKNPRTINRFLKKEVPTVLKGYGSKRNGSILQSYHKEIDAVFEKGMIASKIEKQIRKKGYKGSSSLIHHHQKKTERQRIAMEEEPLHSVKRQDIIQIVYHSKEESQKVTLEEWRLLFD